MSSSTFPPDRFLDLEPAIALADVTLLRLNQFHQRRLLLWFSSGLGWTTVALVVVLLLGMLMDAMWTHPIARLFASIAVYTIVVVACLRLWLGARRRQSDLPAEAKRLERLDPRLRERLLSAVELSDLSTQVSDSPAFRNQLQLQVAQLIDAVDMRQLLPWQNIKRPIAIGLVACAALLLLCVTPSLHVPQRLARILLPMFDWGRVGRIVIAIERPTPHSKTVPSDEIVAITARSDGPTPSSLQLQTRAASGEIRTIDMPPLADRARFDAASPRGRSERFEALLPMEAALLDYRVIGEGASTPWYRLTSVPRPRVTEFEKHITPPEYGHAYRESLTTTEVEPHGNLRVLKGSRVKLLLTLDQPVGHAEWRWMVSPSQTQSGSAQTNLGQSQNAGTSAAEIGAVDTTLSEGQESLQLQPEPGSPRRYAEFVAKHSTSYKIYLQSLDGNITNEYSPTYELQVVDDQAPVIRWLQPRDDRLIATSEQIVTLQHEIIDELPLAQVMRSIRINGSGDWRSTSVDPQSSENTSQFSIQPSASSGGSLVNPSERAASRMDALLQRTSRTQWELDLLPQHAKPGDYFDVKLSATDLSGQVGESTVLRIDIAPTMIAFDAQLPELGRRQVAQRLAAVASKFAQAMQVLQDASSAQSTEANLQTSVDHATAAQRVAAELRSEIAQTIAVVEQAATGADDVLSSQALARSGEILASLRMASAESWEEKVALSATLDRQKWEQNLGQTRRQIEEESKLASELSRQFESMSTYDALSRHGRQIARLAHAEQQLEQATGEDSQTPEQLKRRQQVLAEQLKIGQKTMLDSLPHVRPDSRQPLQNSIQQMGQLIESIERFDAYSDRQALEQMTHSIAEQLRRLQLLSQLDGSLSNAVRIAERRLAEMSPATSAPLHELANQLDSEQAPDNQMVEAQTQYSLLQLSTRRNLQRAAAEGDRQYAADIGSAQRALEQLRDDTSLSSKEQSESIREVAGAIDTLQAIHHVEQLQRLMRELLHNERWGERAGEFARHAPRVWDALESRYEHATTALRAAQFPDEILNSINETRWGPAAQRAGQRLSHRAWDPEEPTSAANDVELLLEQLTETREELQERAQQARLKLEQHAPSIRQLAEQAAEDVDRVEQRTTQLAEAIERQEVPNVSTQIDDLHSQTNALKTPLEGLRQALVDQAELQDLLDRQQMQLARSSDAAIDLVDHVAEQLDESLNEFIAQPTSPQMPSKLQNAAKEQSESAAALRQLAEHYGRLESDLSHDANSQAVAEHVAEMAEQLSALRQLSGDDRAIDDESGREQSYQQAQQLADLAQQDPRSLLEQLEQELPGNPPMSNEMSKISRQTTRQALDQLEQAAKQQQQLSVRVEQSDPNFRAQFQLMLHDVQGASNGALKMLDSLASEAKWTASASQAEAILPRIELAEQALRASIGSARDLNSNVPFTDVRAATADLRDRLLAAEAVLHDASKELSQSVSNKIHNDPNELIQRRREMLDRQRRIQQQTVRDAQQVEREEQQRLQQLNEELQQVEQQIQQIAEQQQNARRQLEQQPDQQWLQDQIADRQPQLEMARASRSAIEKLRDAVERRAELARKGVEQMNSQILSELQSDNPAAELSARLSQQSAEASRALADRLNFWQKAQLAQPLASADELAAGKERETELGKVVEDVADDLSRAARHESRLDHQTSGQQLSQAAMVAQSVVDHEMEQSTQQLAESLEEARDNGSKTHQASTTTTQTTLTKSDSVESALLQAAQNLRGAMGEQRAERSPAAANNQMPATSASAANSSNPASTTANPDSSSASDDMSSPIGMAGRSPLDGQQKARLLDELDRKLNQQAALGRDGEPNSASQPSATEPRTSPGNVANRTPANTLAEGARRLSQSLSRARQAPTPPGESPNSLANSKSHWANAKPQSSSPARVVPVDRGGRDWGLLREQAADDLLEGRRDDLAPQYQKQIDAYFRELAEQARE